MIYVQGNNDDSQKGKGEGSESSNSDSNGPEDYRSHHKTWALP